MSWRYCAIACCVWLAGCATHAPAAGRGPCGDGEQAWQRSTLYFGTDIPTGGTVDARAWDGFLASEVSPRFPDGLTWFDAHGQWRGDDRRIVHEDTHVLVLLHAGDVASHRDVAAIAAAYRQRFAQQSVLEEHTGTCVRFH